MPPPKRTKVASKAAVPRVNPLVRKSSRTIKTKKLPVEIEHVMSGTSGHGEVLPAKVHGRDRGRATARKVVSDQTQTRALDALRNRRDDALKAQGKRQTATPPAMCASSTLTARGPSLIVPFLSGHNAETQIRSEKTPPIYDPDDELYGLSPAGEISLAKIEASRMPQQGPSTTQKQVTTIPPSALKVRHTPAAETSYLALANFKRRPRQPSIIRLVQQASEIGDDLDFDYLEPEDESTPLNVNKSKNRESLSSQPGRNASPQTSSSRKRKFDEVQHLESSPLLLSSPPPSVLKSPSLPRQLPPQPQRYQSEELPFQEHPSHPPHSPAQPTNSDTMADPHSSSSLPRPSPTARKHQYHKPHPTNLSPRTRKKGRSHAPTTADLQTLLPRPRRRATAKAKLNNVLDLSSNGPHESENGGDGVETRDILVDRKSEENTRRKVKRTKGTRLAGKKTYGRRKEEEREKENYEEIVRPGDDESEGSYGGTVRIKGIKDVAKSKELEAARRKFAEVDEWEMEFESVDIGGTGSSWR